MHPAQVLVTGQHPPLDPRGLPLRVPALIPIQAPIHTAPPSTSQSAPLNHHANIHPQQTEPLLYYGPSLPQQQQQIQQTLHQQQHPPSYNPAALQNHDPKALNQVPTLNPHKPPTSQSFFPNGISTDTAAFPDPATATRVISERSANAKAQAHLAIANAQEQAKAEVRRGQPRENDRQRQASSQDHNQSPHQPQHQHHNLQPSQPDHNEIHQSDPVSQINPQGNDVDVNTAAVLQQLQDGLSHHPDTAEHQSHGQGQLTPAQLVVNMKAMYEVQQKSTQQSRPTHIPTPQLISQPNPHDVPQEQHHHQPTHHQPTHHHRDEQFQRLHDHHHGDAVQDKKGLSVSGAMPPLHQFAAHASHSQQNTIDVDAATYQLAGTRLEGEEVSAVAAASAAMRRQNQSPTYDNSNIMRTDSTDMDVGSTTLSFSGSGTDSVALATGKEQLQQQQLRRPNQPENQDLEDGKDAKKVRADHVDNFLNGQPASFSFPANGQMFDAFQLPNGKIPPSISQSFSFIMKGGPSRESSMEFRKNTLNGGNRDMSIDFLKRDLSMELVSQVRKSSGDQVSSELPRDMSVDFLGRALSQANRDFSMEMQFPQNHLLNLAGKGMSMSHPAFTAQGAITVRCTIERGFESRVCVCGVNRPARRAESSRGRHALKDWSIAG
ncbi:unnamed protein product [Chondrus crispus]|uniref:Uncharacterized protein n=1 Tax=Chondrus crispus TaxID=2769 RepID=S0F3X0_CHOCR|nr:unnamed protein product [Chondrus crispus]CDF77568.1 unnamed protein product [Chondrus crispus]|eukprot:XP_005718069.1 unnamed protein product [Chondrus crispus]